MKRGFLTHGTSISSSTRIRAEYVAKHIKNSVVSRKTKDLEKMNVVIFQKRFKEKDIEFAKKFKSNGGTIIFDLADPVWDINYPASYFTTTKDKKENFKQMVELSDFITFSTNKLKSMFMENYTFDRTVVIPDRIDLDLHKDIKFHISKKEFVILWHGTKFNIDSINIARNDLERLGLEFKIKLYIVCEKGYKKINSFKNIEVNYYDWDLATINEKIISSDITINPHPLYSYKSNNKTIKSWALGVPCIDNDFYNLGKMYLESHNKRTEDAKKMREYIEKFYDSKFSAFELQYLIENKKTSYIFNFEIPKIEKVLHNVQKGNNIMQKSSEIKISIVLLNDIMEGAYHQGSDRAYTLNSFNNIFSINSATSYLETCDVIIYQDRFEEFDIQFVTRYKNNKLFILDLTDPYFHHKYPYTKSINKSNCTQMMQLVDVVIVSNRRLEKLVKEKFNIDVHLIKDSELTLYYPLIFNKFQNKFNKNLTKFD